MAKLTPIKFKNWDKLGTVQQLINQWNPGVLKSEKEYERSLSTFLRSELEGIKITQQYARDRYRFDIVLNESLAIELKYNLKNVGDFQRLLGQLLLSKRWEGQVLVLLVGDTDPDILDSLMREAKELEPSHMIPGVSNKFSIIRNFFFKIS
jgi:hypothetical protein